MDDCIAAVAAAVAAYRRREQIIKTIYQLALVLELLDEEDAIVSQGGRRTYHMLWPLQRVVQQLRPR